MQDPRMDFPSMPLIPSEIHLVHILLLIAVSNRSFLLVSGIFHKPQRSERNFLECYFYYILLLVTYILRIF